MFSSIRPIAGEMPMRTPSGIASIIFSRMLNSVSMMNTMPSASTMISAAWNDAT